MDIDLLSIVKERDKYNRFKPYISEWVLGKEAQLIFTTIEAFFKQFPAVSTIDWTAFESFFFIYRNSTVRKDTAPLYKAIFNNLRAHTPSVASEDVLRHFITQEYSRSIADTALQVREGTASIDDVSDLVKKYDKELGRAINPTDLFVTGGVTDVLARASAPGFNWRLNELNISCGPLRQGDFVLLAAYVETGKTTFTASEVSHMATQIAGLGLGERPVVWINNEERSDKVMLRIMQAALGCTLADIMADEAKCTAEYNRLMGMPNRILVLNNDSGMNNAHKLTPLLRDLNPALIVFDQLDKVEGFNSKEEGEHSRLGRLYKWARDLSHDYGPVIAVSQTDASGASSQYITMDQLRGSKVDKPGEADAIITIGKAAGPSMDKQRFLHVPKNKLFGGPMSDETHRHGYWEVAIKPEVARYEGTR